VSHNASGLLAVEVTGDVDWLLGNQTKGLHVFGVHEEHAPFVLDAAIAIIGPIDGGVELVVAMESL